MKIEGVSTNPTNTYLGEINETDFEEIHSLLKRNQKTKKLKYEKTLEFYSFLFGEPPSEVWESLNERFEPNTTSCCLVDLKRYVRYIGVIHKMNLNWKINIDYKKIPLIFEF